MNDFRPLNTLQLKSFIFGIILIFHLMSCTKNTLYKQANCEDFAQLITEDSVVVLDVRTPKEFETGHIERALLINFKDSTFTEQVVQNIDKKKTIAIYCQVGIRSAAAAELLTNEGFRVVNLEGGYSKFKKKQTISE